MTGPSLSLRRWECRLWLFTPEINRGGLPIPTVHFQTVTVGDVLLFIHSILVNHHCIYFSILFTHDMLHYILTLSYDISLFLFRHTSGHHCIKRKMKTSVLIQYEIKNEKVTQDETLGHMGAGPALCWAYCINPSQPSVIQFLPLEQKLKANVCLCDLRSAEWNHWANTPLECLRDCWRWAAGRGYLVSTLACWSETEQNTGKILVHNPLHGIRPYNLDYPMSSRLNEHKRINCDSKHRGNCKWEGHVLNSKSPNSKE